MPIRIDQNKEQNAASTWGSATSTLRRRQNVPAFEDRRPDAVQLQRLQQMASDHSSKHTVPLQDQRPEAAAQRKRQDLMSRGMQGKLADGEVQLSHQPDIGALHLPDLAQSLAPIRNTSARPVADALESHGAVIDDDKVLMKGISGAPDPGSIARQVGQLRPQQTRILRAADGRFQLQAKLNPWVLLATGKTLPELPIPREEPPEDTAHLTLAGVVWRNKGEEKKAVLPTTTAKRPTEPITESRKTEDKEKAAPDGVVIPSDYAGFKEALIAIDTSGDAATERQKAKERLLLAMHGKLKELPAKEVLKFGVSLQAEIKAHDDKDTLETAFADSRVVYRSWHKPRHLSKAEDVPYGVKGGEELAGADSLRVALNPTRFKNHKAKTKDPESDLAPLGAGPSTLLSPGQTNTVFLRDRGTATALLPENLYAGFSAYNETAKARIRSQSDEKLDPDDVSLRDHAKDLRATVTRPIFFNNDDIQTSTRAFKHADKPGWNVRKVHSDQDGDSNPLRKSLADKLTDPLHANALFYQTFWEHSKPAPESQQWNEMLVKYRQTGHMAGLHENIRAWVPGLPPNSAIEAKLEDSGKFSDAAVEYKVDAEKELRGEDYDLAKKSKTQPDKAKAGKKKGKGK